MSFQLPGLSDLCSYALSQARGTASSALSKAGQACARAKPVIMTATAAATAAAAASAFGDLDRSQSLFAGALSGLFTAAALGYSVPTPPLSKKVGDVFASARSFVTGRSTQPVIEAVPPPAAAQGSSPPPAAQAQGKRSAERFGTQAGRKVLPVSNQVGSTVDARKYPRLYIHEFLANVRAKVSQDATISIAEKCWKNFRSVLVELCLITNPFIPSISKNLNKLGRWVARYGKVLSVPVLGQLAFLVIFTLQSLASLAKGLWWCGKKAISFINTKTVTTEDPNHLDRVKQDYYKEGQWDLSKLKKQIENDIPRTNFKVKHTENRQEEKKEIKNFEQLIQILGLRAEIFEKTFNQTSLTEAEKQALDFLVLFHQGVIGSINEQAYQLFLGRGKEFNKAVGLGYGISNPRAEEAQQDSKLKVKIKMTWPPRADRPDFVCSTPLYLVNKEDRLCTILGRAEIKNGKGTISLSMPRAAHHAAVKRIEADLERPIEI